MLDRNITQMFFSTLCLIKINFKFNLNLKSEGYKENVRS